MLVLAGSRDLNRVDFHALLTSTVALPLTASSLDEYATHSFSSRPEEVSAVLPRLLLAFNQAQPGLVDQRGWLQCMPGRLLDHFAGSQSAQFLVNERQQFVRGFRVALLNSIEKASDLAHGQKDTDSLRDVER